METTQAGCELIGDSSSAADAEMIAALIESILSTGLTEFQVEVGHVGFFSGITAEAGLTGDSIAELKEIIRNKNLFSIEALLTRENIDEKYNDIFYRLPQMFGDVNILSQAASMTKNETALSAISHLEEVYDILKDYGYEKYVSFDLGVLSELDYYTGVIFKAYTFDVGEPIANGGRYDNLIGQFGKDKASIGFCITIDLLHLAIIRQKIVVVKPTKNRLIVYDESNLKEAVRLAGKLRKEGINTVLSGTCDDESKYSEVIVMKDMV